MTDVRTMAADDAETLAQMRDAPPGAVFVIHHMRAIGYFRACADIAGRDDFVFISLATVRLWSTLNPSPKAPVVIDHYARGVATPDQLKRLRAAGAKIG